MRILGVESSCDESALAILDDGRGMMGEWVHSQIAEHAVYGGVVPDLASRQHLDYLPRLLERVEAEHGLGAIDEVAVTAGPGLAGCLALGMALARGVGMARGIPVRGVNHLRGHVFSPFMALHGEDPGGFASAMAAELPHLGLVVSGGNTLLVAVEKGPRLRVLAQTVDDAAGEALDKGAKLLGMAYPGGPEMEKAAAGGNAKAYAFPRAFAGRRELRFSFSGLKTSLRYRLEKMSDAELEAVLPDLCASYQEAVVDSLLKKTWQLVRAGGWRSLGLSGGVANNGRLRGGFEEMGARAGLPVRLAQRRHTGDNAGMIAFARMVDPEGCLANAAVFEPSWEVA